MGWRGFGPFYHLLQNFLRIFSGRNLLWHALAIVLTIVIVTTDTDWAYYQATRGETIQRLALPAIILGGLLPILTPIVLVLAGLVFEYRPPFTRPWSWGLAALLIWFVVCLLLATGFTTSKASMIPNAWFLWQAILLGLFVAALLLAASFAIKERPIFTHAWFLGQATVLGWFVACIYKAFTGREHPPWHWISANAVANAVNSSHGFHFGFMRGGVFWGWPSSHTCVAFATMVCLARMHPKSKPLVCVTLLYALYVGMGVSVSIHWLSEFVAGAIIGSVIGVVVGNSFAARFNSLGVKA